MKNKIRHFYKTKKDQRIYRIEGGELNSGFFGFNLMVDVFSGRKFFEFGCNLKKCTYLILTKEHYD